jgi:hypothetical protein
MMVLSVARVGADVGFDVCACVRIRFLCSFVFMLDVHVDGHVYVDVYIHADVDVDVHVDVVVHVGVHLHVLVHAHFCASVSVSRVYVCVLFRVGRVCE